jgi:hypothetical protein
MFTKRKIGGTNSPSSHFSKISSNHFFQKKSNKSGQVTIFIILGILLLLAAILIILLQQEMITLSADIIPKGKGTVEDFVTQCITDVGNDALTRAGIQGGYIDVPERYTQDITWNLQLSPFTYVPLWANGNQRDVPTLEYIKQVVDKYIEENVRDCLFGSGAFAQTYDLIENSGVESNTEFIESGTVFNVRWNLLIQDKSGEVVAEIIDHVAQSPIRFKTIYGMANAILDRELFELKIEDLTQDLIALEHDDVPVAGVALQCTQKRWKVSEAENTLKDMLRVNLRNLKIKGTEFVEFPETLPYYQNHYVWDVEKSAQDVTVLFRFEEDYPFIFQVTPQNGKYMKSEKLGGESILDFLCLQQWKFTYDVVYPVLVEVRDGHSGALFQMAFDVRLVRNYPYRGEVQSRPNVPTSQSDEEAFCLDTNYVVPMTVETYSIVDNPTTGVYFKDPVDGASITYTCLKYKCEMGESEYNFVSRGDVAGISTNFPYCVDAIVRAEKEGYVGAVEFVNAQEGAIVELNLKPLYKIPVSQMSVIKHHVSIRDCSDEEKEEKGDNAVCLDIGPGIALGSSESALVSLTSYEVNETELSLENNESSEETQSNGALGLVGAEFLSDAVVEHKTEFIISSSIDNAFEDDVAEFLAEADFEYAVRIYLVNEQELIGGYTQNWEADWSELNSNGNLEFHVLDANPQEEAAYYELLSDLQMYSGKIELPQVK